jgi:hypothetical protein
MHNRSFARKNRRPYTFCGGENDAWTLPTLDFRGVPLLIDFRRVLNNGRTPILDNATVDKNGEFIGNGGAHRCRLLKQHCALFGSRWNCSIEQRIKNPEKNRDVLPEQFENESYRFDFGRKYHAQGSSCSFGVTQVARELNVKQYRSDHKDTFF